jgi:hypothetical protein
MRVCLGCQCLLPRAAVEFHAAYHRRYRIPMALVLCQSVQEANERVLAA